MNWLQPKNFELRALVEAFKKRHKSIHISGQISQNCGITEESEWIQINYEAFGKSSHPIIELTVWEDFFIDLYIKSRRKKSLNKKILYIEGVQITSDADLVVKTFEATINCLLSRDMHKALDLWLHLERKSKSTR